MRHFRKKLAALEAQEILKWSVCPYKCSCSAERTEHLNIRGLCLTFLFCSSMMKPTCCRPETSSYHTLNKPSRSCNSAMWRQITIHCVSSSFLWAAASSLRSSQRRRWRSSALCLCCSHDGPRVAHVRPPPGRPGVGLHHHRYHHHAAPLPQTAPERQQAGVPQAAGPSHGEDTDWGSDWSRSRPYFRF